VRAKAGFPFKISDLGLVSFNSHDKSRLLYIFIMFIKELKRKRERKYQNIPKMVGFQ
jgi:hypothetical protein